MYCGDRAHLFPASHGSRPDSPHTPMTRRSPPRLADRGPWRQTRETTRPGPRDVQGGVPGGVQGGHWTGSRDPRRDPLPSRRSNSCTYSQCGRDFDWRPALRGTWWPRTELGLSRLDSPDFVASLFSERQTTEGRRQTSCGTISQTETD